jgi:transposase
LALELTDTGFDYSVLSEFRARLLQGGQEAQLLETLLTLFQEKGWLKARGVQRTDSTHVLAAIHFLHRLELVGETLRAALNALAVAAPDWLQARIQPEWADRYVVRFGDRRLPQKEADRQALMETIGADGRRLLTAIYASPAPGWLRELPAVEVLRRVWLQQFYASETPEATHCRALEDVPPAKLNINSPYDPEARFSQKRSTTWIGYRVHLTETCDTDSPHLITNVETTPAQKQDAEMTAPIHQALAAKALLPAVHCLDAGYMSAELWLSGKTEHQIELIGVKSAFGRKRQADRKEFWSIRLSNETHPPAVRFDSDLVTIVVSQEALWQATYPAQKNTNYSQRSQPRSTMPNLSGFSLSCPMI